MDKLIEYLKSFIGTKTAYEQYVDSASNIYDYEKRQVEYDKVKALYFVGA